MILVYSFPFSRYYPLADFGILVPIVSSDWEVFSPLLFSEKDCVELVLNILWTFLRFFQWDYLGLEISFWGVFLNYSSALGLYWDLPGQKGQECLLAGMSPCCFPLWSALEVLTSLTRPLLKPTPWRGGTLYSCIRNRGRSSGSQFSLCWLGWGWGLSYFWGVCWSRVVII